VMEDWKEKFALGVKGASVLAGGISQACSPRRYAPWKMMEKKLWCMKSGKDEQTCSYKKVVVLGGNVYFLVTTA